MPLRRLSARVAFPLRWSQGSLEGDQLCFNALLVPWNLYDPIWVIDLHPADPSTWAWVGSNYA